MGGAVSFGGGYVIYKTVKGKTQDASPIQLHVLVKSATGLKDEDTWGQSDPYCVVEVDDVKKRTKTVDNNHDPVWNEELTLGVFKDTWTRTSSSACGMTITVATKSWARC